MQGGPRIWDRSQDSSIKHTRYLVWERGLRDIHLVVNELVVRQPCPRRGGEAGTGSPSSGCTAAAANMVARARGRPSGPRANQRQSRESGHSRREPLASNGGVSSIRTVYDLDDRKALHPSRDEGQVPVERRCKRQCSVRIPPSMFGLQVST